MIAFTREKVQQIYAQLTSLKNHWRSFFSSFLKGVLISLILLVVGGYSTFRLIYRNKILPNVYLLHVEMTHNNPNEAILVANDLLEKYLTSYSKFTITHKSNQWDLPVSDLGLEIDDRQLTLDLMSVGRSGSLLDQLSDQWSLLNSYHQIPLPIEYDRTLMSDFISTASAQIENPMIPPSIYKGTRYNPKTQSLIYVERGQAGEKAYITETAEVIDKNISYLQTPPHALITKIEEVIFSEDDYLTAISRAKSILNKNLSLSYINPRTNQPESWTLSDADLLSFLSISEGVNAEAILAYGESAMQTINSPAQNAVFRHNPTTSKVEAFKPGVDGVKVQIDRLTLMISEGIEDLITSLNTPTILVPTINTPPPITTSDVNDLGVQDLIGRGESTYYHSSVSRKYNVEYAAALLDGVLIPPGEKFSFNGVIGEISLATGFKQAMIIKDGETILGDGGGVCQDSTTLFRAALDAGLSITGWRNHSFRVGYYEQNSKPGFDATIFSPLPDLAFTNNTPGHILIQTTAENMKLTYELYGTDDGRVATISNYTQWDAAPPPPDLYKDDPTLAVGVVKKVESAVPGLKTKFDYNVTRDGEVLFEKTFLSVYRPWQAVYLRGTKPI